MIAAGIPTCLGGRWRWNLLLRGIDRYNDVVLLTEPLPRAGTTESFLLPGNSSLDEDAINEETGARRCNEAVRVAIVNGLQSLEAPGLRRSSFSDEEECLNDRRPEIETTPWRDVVPLGSSSNGGSRTHGSRTRGFLILPDR